MAKHRTPQPPPTLQTPPPPPDEFVLPDGVTRRDFLKASALVAGALGVAGSGLLSIDSAIAKEAANGGLSVIWLQGAGCSGCSVSLLNTIYYATIDDLLLNTLDLNYHPTIMAAAGADAVRSATDAKAAGNYVLCVECAIPTGQSGKFCTLWPGMTAMDGVKQFAAGAAYVMAVGTCAAYGGVSMAAPNPTGVQPLSKIIGRPTINIPGCPAHPDWVVGTIASILKNGKAPTLDAQGRPTDFFANTVHSHCPLRDTDGGALGRYGCQRPVGCKGPSTHADCPVRRWNGGRAATPGVNFCCIARTPCQGCTEPNFPDGMSPFFLSGGGGGSDDGGSTTRPSGGGSGGTTRPVSSDTSVSSGSSGGTTRQRRVRRDD